MKRSRNEESCSPTSPADYGRQALQLAGTLLQIQDVHRTQTSEISEHYERTRSLSVEACFELPHPIIPRDFDIVPVNTLMRQFIRIVTPAMDYEKLCQITSQLELTYESEFNACVSFYKNCAPVNQPVLVDLYVNVLVYSRFASICSSFISDFGVVCPSLFRTDLNFRSWEPFQVFLNFQSQEVNLDIIQVLNQILRIKSADDFKGVRQQQCQLFAVYLIAQLQNGNRDLVKMAMAFKVAHEEKIGMVLNLMLHFAIAVAE
ncbi:Hypothetical_protein [Hexamita inflata]|uniref:Hypothetical_protein n=1 Tax=Hexamita inflata TaxID=28002 RepID=A0AA86V071_9EUKA|nr:Hypothetical protein HINF_LOCUS62984 [Hexamita inflata]